MNETKPTRSGRRARQVGDPGAQGRPGPGGPRHPLARPLYGLEILRRLDADAGMSIPEGTIYPLLSRMKAEGLVDSEWVEADAGHPRKYYRLTDPGRAGCATWRGAGGLRRGAGAPARPDGWRTQ